MRVASELNQNELEELRDRYFHQLEEMDEDVLGDYTTAEEIPMSNIIAHYEGTFFVEDDFWCNQENSDDTICDCGKNIATTFNALTGGTYCKPCIDFLTESGLH
jgi:hypothetical protein